MQLSDIPRPRDPARRYRRFTPIALALALTLGASSSRAAVFTVGAGTGCTHGDLASALTAAASLAGADEIRLLANTTHQGQFIIITDGLSLRGGFASCTASSPTGSTTLRGDNSNRAVFLAASGGVFFERLNLTGGSVTGNGGGLYIQGDQSISMVNVSIFGNAATGRGGNLYINAFPGLDLSFSGTSLITAGDAVDGGGLACAGDGRIRLFAGTSVANNSATGNGGGAYISTSCDLELYAGGTDGGILTNTAGNSGGGVYIESGAELNTGFSASDLSLISGNAAGNGGGGVFLTDPGSVMRAFFTRITGNSAGGAGGAFFADNDSIVAVGHPSGASNPCFDKLRCARLDHNTAAVGGAIYSDDGADVTIHGTHLEANVATLFNPVASIRGGSTLFAHSTVIAKNDGQTLFTVSDAASALTLANVTIADNINFGPGVISVVNATIGPLRIWSSVFDQLGPLFVPGFPAGIAPQLDCVMTRHAGLLASIPPASVQRAIQVANPLLSNPAAGNYMLSGLSPAIDFCDTTVWSGGERDVEWNLRDLDDPGHPNPLGGFRDLGADEYTVLFADGFEGGNTAAWTLTQP